jgi:hypothetical protein
MKNEEHDSDLVAAKAVAMEFTLRLRHALEHSRQASALIERSRRGELAPNQIHELLEDILSAARMADRGFRFDQLCDVHDINGAWAAAEAIIIRFETEGIAFHCATSYGCVVERLCAMNNVIDRKIEDGCKATGVIAKHFPVPYTAMSDGCTKMEPRVFQEGDPCLATSSRWTGDTARVKAKG